MNIFDLIKLFKVQKGRGPSPGELADLKRMIQQDQMNKNVIQFPGKDKAKVKAQIDAEPNMLQRELMEVSDDVSPSYASGDTKYNAQVLADGLAEKRFNVEFDDLDQYEQMGLYDESYKYLTQLRKNFKQPEFPPKAVMDNLDAEGLANIMRKKGIDMEVGTASKTTKKKPNIDSELQKSEDSKNIFNDFSTRNLTPIEAMEEASSLIGRKGKYKNISESEAKKKLGELESIIKSEKLEPEDVVGDDLGDMLKDYDGDPDAMAQGGIIGLKQGGPPNPGRRSFMKLMAGLATLPVFGKFFKGAKVSSKIPVLKNTTTTMPAWFPDLVDKFIAKGVGKKIDEDLIEYTTKDLPGIKMTKSDDGRIYVEGQNDYGRSYDMEYQPPGYEVVDYKTGKAVKTKGDFTAQEEVPVNMDPDGNTDFEGEILESVDDILTGDARSMEGFAKGRKISFKEKSYAGESKSGQAEVAAENRADAFREQEAMDAEDFAEGGLAYLLGEK